MKHSIPELGTLSIVDEIEFYSIREDKPDEAVFIGSEHSYL